MKSAVIILKAGLLVGTLDIIAACIQFPEPSIIFKFIASGVFGADAYTGGSLMVTAGLVFHYIIALGFTLLFFMIYPKILSIIKNSMLIGILYGAFIWGVMKFIVIPLSHIPSQPFNYYREAIAMIILIACIGIPLSMIAARKQRSEYQ